MSVVNLDALARAFGVKSDAALAEELRGLWQRTEAVIQDVTVLGRAGQDVPGFVDAVRQAGGWLDEATACIDAALAACEDHQRGVS